MKRKNIVLIGAIIICVLLLITLILIERNRDDRPFNRHEFPSTIVVENGTQYIRADTIAMVLANKIFKIDTINLMMIPMPEVLNSGEYEFYGIVVMLPFKPNQFLILLNRKNMSLTKIKETLAHEFIHIDQYLRGDLQLLSNYAIWKGDTIMFKDFDYLNRPFEKEAYENQHKIKKELEKLLYD